MPPSPIKSTHPDGMPSLPVWSPESHLALMSKHSISKSILSISSPGCHLTPSNTTLARSLARECNAYAAKLKKEYPDNLGYFASLPLPDVEGSLEEIGRAVEEGCDGFALLTNAQGKYMGDGIFDEVFEELERRKAVVFVHPTTPRCPCSEGDGGGREATPFAGRLPNPMLEFFFDTARVVTNLFLSGTMRRCPNVKFILPHLGGAFPPLLSRWTGFSQLVPGPWGGSVTEEEVKEAFQRQIWFDMAGFAFPSQIRGLVEGVGVGHTRLLYGSDYPFTKEDGVELLLGQMEEGVKGLFDEEQVKDICYRNAEKLFGRERA
ncbi:Putative 2-amino-3-carboxymuconate-6-semialdehyde decarboxylase, metal-dependent hydrolase [Septoria linicola]|uniref:6-methylsalicylate decarboxylase n=1 Tax=Septoria linicola TaxID=215465 RepID=A0A9Q9ASQ0_9PEZI|nr:Putative 2-amino-3-carboxymuconate-6-semialdehyde decarboxylase, metal-dependent hydrolase [Septoria linicola]